MRTGSDFHIVNAVRRVAQLTCPPETWRSAFADQTVVVED